MRHERETQSPVREGPYISPRPQVAAQPQAFLRTHSSPSVIDASPKPKLNDTSRDESTTTPSPTSVSGATFSPRTNGCHKSELTPVMSNAAREASVISSPGHLENISVPTAKIFKSSAFDKNSNMTILPRKSNDGAEGIGVGTPPVPIRPISPPSWPVHRQISSSTVHKSQSTKVNATRSTNNNNKFVGPSGHRMRSAFPAPSETHKHPNTQARTQTRTQRSHVRQMKVPLSSSPQRIIPYQPSRDESLAGVGMSSDDENVQSIFLNHHYRNHSTDESHETFDTASSVSIPSIYHASRIRCETHDDSVSGYAEGQPLTYLGGDDDDDDEEEDSYMMVDDEPNEEGADNGAGADLITVGEMQCAAFLPEEKKSSRSSSRSKQETRYMSPEKEREVYQWLQSLEVDKDNNEYVAEAASSKFLRGKMDLDDAALMQPAIPLKNACSLTFEPSNEKTAALSLMQPAIPLNTTSSLTFEPSSEKMTVYDEEIPYSSDSDSEYTYEPKAGCEIVSNTTPPASPKSRPSTGNKEVMGINVNLYRSGKGGKKPANQSTLRSRATR